MFQDRDQAGRLLARELAELPDRDAVVLGLPRGGVPVAYQVARALHAPMDVIVVRKVGVPWQPELAMGAVGEDGADVVNAGVVRATRVDPQELAAAQEHARAELQRRVRALRGDRPRVPLTGRTAIVVDDGIATGSTARAACRVARQLGAAKVLLAVPVAPPGAVADLGEVADRVISLRQPADFRAVGRFYRDFRPVTDEQVVAILDRATATGGDPPAADEDVVVDAGGIRLPGHLSVRAGALGLVIFVHGSGSSRHSPRNSYVARALQRARLDTLLFDLLTAEEEADRRNVFDIELLAVRLLGVVAWARRRPAVAGLPVGLFGASTGAAAALWAAAEPDADIAAVVSRGGRPDLAGPRLTGVRAPTLLIVGGRDADVLDLNRRAQAQLRCPHRLTVVTGAGHLFEEPGTLHTAARLATDWFTDHLSGTDRRRIGRPEGDPHPHGRS